jgi:cell wall-associated NlpC family hydrolase
MPRKDPEKGSATVIVAAGAALLLLLAVLMSAVAVVPAQEAAACASGTQPAADKAASAIPASYLADYEKAGAQYGIPWTVLAAIGTIESDNGVNDGPSSAGALGPMQFEPSTWQLYGDGGNIQDPADAIPAAARLLVASGAPADMQQAIFAYNHAGWYVSEVLALAASYGTGGAQAVTAASSALCEQAALGPLPPGTAGKVIRYAEAQLGKRYVFGGTGPDAFDCSGLAMMAYRAAGIAIPRTAAAQWAFGRKIPASQVNPGDLVFFSGADGTPVVPGHVGIVTGTGSGSGSGSGSGTMIEAYAVGYPVRVATFGKPDSPPGDQVVVGFTRP